MKHDHIKLRNAVTELWNDGASLGAMSYWLGKDEATILRYLDCARRGFHTPRQEAEAAEESESRSKASEGGGKVIPHVRAKKPLGGRTEAFPRTLKDLVSPEADEERMYLNGNYRKGCRKCGKPIVRTGIRGRAPHRHRECK